MKPLSARQRQVLQATVHHYVDTIEPVGSRTLVQRFGIPASSATVRSAMGVLEQRGLLAFELELLQLLQFLLRSLPGQVVLNY